ncbi:hypothetical protein [Halopenitus persicus]|uniref:hypothetical protein n=1 Tax=Halopenitus persicus TaxID=1048396 RepID=UPI000BBAA98F|nr:hypothetical protein [Halopenitus persicus]
MSASDEPLPDTLREAIAATVRKLRTARREALAAYPTESRRWEYDGRTWDWPGGEELPYFFELCEGEEAALSALEERFGLSRLGVGTGRVVLTGAFMDGPADDGGAEGGTIADGGAEGGTIADGGTEDAAVRDGGRAIKLARYGPSAEMGDGRRQNRLERELSAAIGDHPFLPVLRGDPDGDWVVMPRARVLDADDPETERALESVRTALAPYADRVHFDELKPENVGHWNGREWLLDYGRPSEDRPESGADRF